MFSVFDGLVKSHAWLGCSVACVDVLYAVSVLEEEISYQDTSDKNVIKRRHNTHRHRHNMNYSICRCTFEVPFWPNSYVNKPGLGLEKNINTIQISSIVSFFCLVLFLSTSHLLPLSYQPREAKFFLLDTQSQYHCMLPHREVMNLREYGICHLLHIWPPKKLTTIG